MRRPLRAVPLALTLLALTPNLGSSQSRGFLGISIERFYHEGARFTAVNFRLTQMDLNAGLVPVALQGGLLLLDLDIGLAKALAIGPATLLLKGGVGNFLILGLHADSEFYPGLQGGLAAVLPVQRQFAIRADLSRRVYFPAGRILSDVECRHRVRGPSLEVTPGLGPCPSPDPEAQ